MIKNFLKRFKSYSHFTEGVDFACWWSCIGKGLRLQATQQACFNYFCLDVIIVQVRIAENILWFQSKFFSSKIGCKNVYYKVLVEYSLLMY